MMTRDAVQGFIDGWNAAQPGSTLSTQATQSSSINNPTAPAPQLADYVSAWLINHPVYPQDTDTAQLIVNDLGSYRNAV